MVLWFLLATKHPGVSSWSNTQIELSHDEHPPLAFSPACVRLGKLLSFYRLEVRVSPRFRHFCIKTIIVWRSESVVPEPPI